MSADQDQGLHGTSGMIRLVLEAQGVDSGLSLYGVEFGPGTHRRIADLSIPNSRPKDDLQSSVN